MTSRTRPTAHHLLAALLLAAACAPSLEEPPGPATLYSDETPFAKLGPPEPGDWRASFDEPDQTFRDYVDSDPVRVGGGRTTLAFVLIGEFPPDRREIAERTAEFAGLWFDLPVMFLPDEFLPEAGHQRVREFPWSREPVTQYRTGWFLRGLLPPLLPDDAVLLAGITLGDLYPGDRWNYVFGQATFEDRVAVYSLRRFFDSFWGRPPDGETRTRALLRSLKLTTHEIGHAFGLRHCTFYECGMNGSNSLEESDRGPIHLCPVCLKKLSWNRDFDPVARYEALGRFYGAQGLVREAEWVARRLERLRRLGGGAEDGVSGRNR